MVAAVRQRIGDPVAVAQVVLDHQDMRPGARRLRHAIDAVRQAGSDGQHEVERAPPPHHAANADAAALGLHEPPRQRQPEAGALVALRVAVVELLELDEEARQVDPCDAHAGILDLDTEIVLAFGERAHGDVPAVRTELDRVGQVVEQRLLQSRGVDHDGRNLRRDLDAQGQPLALQQREQHAAHIVDQLGELHRFREEFELARFDLRQVQDIVDQLQQVAPAGPDVPDELPLLRGLDGHPVHAQQVGEADDRVHRRTQLVRHVGEELALEPVRFLDLAVVALEALRAQAGVLGALLFGHVGHDAKHPVRVAGVVARAAVDAQPMDALVGPDHPEFGAPVVLAQQSAPIGERDVIAILRMHVQQERRDAPLRLQLLVSEAMVVAHRAVHGASTQVEVPVSDPGDLEREPQARLALAKCREHPALRADVTRDLGSADDVPRTVPDRRDRDRQVQPPAVLGQAHGLEWQDGLAVEDVGEDVHLFFAPIRRNEHLHRLAENLFRGVSEQVAGSPVPRRDPAVERLADDRVVGRFDDGREAPAGLRSEVSAGPVLDDRQHASDRSVGGTLEFALDFHRRPHARARDRADAMGRLDSQPLFGEYLDDGPAVRVRRTILPDEDLPVRMPRRLAMRPARDALGHRIHPGHVALRIGGDQPGVDAGERHREVLLHVDGLLLRGLPAADFALERLHRVLQRLDRRQLDGGRDQAPDGHGRGKRQCGSHGLDRDLRLVVGLPDGPDVHQVRESAREDERAEQHRHAPEPAIGPLPHQDQDADGDGEVREGDQQVGGHHGPQQARRPGQAITMRQESVAAKQGQQVHGISRYRTARTLGATRRTGSAAI